MPLWNPLAGLGDIGAVANQYGLTYLAFLVVVPAGLVGAGPDPLGLSIRAVGENPEAADAAGISVVRIRYVALMIGGALMAVGGAFITLADAGQLHPGHHRGPRLGVHRPRHLRALAHLARRAGGARLRGRLLAGPAPAHHARLRGRAHRSCCWRCPTSRSSRPWPCPAATCPTRAPTSSRTVGPEPTLGRAAAADRSERGAWTTRRS